MNLSSWSSLQVVAGNPVYLLNHWPEEHSLEVGLCTAESRSAHPTLHGPCVCGNQNKLKKGSCHSCTPGPASLLLKLRGEWAEGFAYTAEPTSLQNLEFVVRDTVMPPSTNSGHTPSCLKTRVSTSLHYPAITCADGKYAAWQQTCLFPGINGL